jgi:rhodanese-related sulfurtransferase
LDVREPAELESDGFIEGAVNMPVRQVLQNLDKLPALGEPIVIYCASGHRGALALVALQLLGYTDVNNLGGGLGAWKKADLPVVMGEAPAEAVAGEMPQVDETMLGKLDAYMSTLPEGFGTIKAADLNAILADTPPFILDVRAPEELTTDGYIEGSVNIPLRELFTRLSELPADKTTPMVVLCKSGHRGAIAQMALQLNGYSDVKNLGGGIGAWIGAELEVVK